MVREDIIGGLKNAFARGEKLENAIRSFINAGYSEKDVREAAKQFQEGAISLTSDLPQTKSTIQPVSFTTENPKRRRSKKIIIMVILLIFLVLILITTILFKEQIINYFSN